MCGFICCGDPCLTGIKPKEEEEEEEKDYKLNVHLCDNQNAYVGNAGTTVALIAMLDDWTRLLDISGIMAVRLLLVDMTKAFDGMDHHILAKKQIENGVNQNIIDLCSEFLSKQLQRVMYKGYSSEYLQIPQESRKVLCSDPGFG